MSQGKQKQYFLRISYYDASHTVAGLDQKMEQEFPWDIIPFTFMTPLLLVDYHQPVERMMNPLWLRWIVRIVLFSSEAVDCEVLMHGFNISSG
jgi:hypothetical protein